MNNKPTYKTAIVFGIAALASACSIASQPSESAMSAMFKAFTEHPTHCLSLLEGRTPVQLEGKAINPAQDQLASSDVKAMHAAARDGQQRLALDRSLVFNCTAKHKN